MILRAVACLAAAAMMSLPVAAPAQPTAPEAPPSAARYDGSPGPWTVRLIDGQWTDTGRDDRVVPFRIYVPSNTPSPDRTSAPHPVVIFSHGLGGSREGYEYLGRHWASHGYVSVHLTHIGSDRSLIADARTAAEVLPALRKAAADPRNTINRPLDVRFALDQLQAMDRDGKLPAKLDLQRIGMAGHSFGAFTTNAIAGQNFSGVRGGGRSFVDPRVKAVIPMSTPRGRLATDAQRDSAYGSITVPSLHMTGTLDHGTIDSATAADRRIPFDHAKNCERWLITFIGGDHMVFSGRSRMPADQRLGPGHGGDGRKDAEFQRLIRACTQAFWDAHLRQDADAGRWLAGDGVRETLGAEATVEHRSAVEP